MSRVWYILTAALVSAIAGCGDNVGEASTPGACWKGPSSSDKWPPTCWRPYSPKSAFNKPIGDNPRLLANSPRIVDRILGKIDPIPDTTTGLRPGNIEAPESGNGGEPSYWLDPPNANTYTIKCGEFGPCELNDKQVAIPAGATVEGGWAAPLSQADRHLTLVDWAAKREVNLWHVNGLTLPKDGSDLVVGNGGKADLNGNGKSATPGSTGTAARVAGLAGRVRIEELAGGYPRGAPANIRHALAIVIDCHNGTTVWPATGNAPTPGRCSQSGRTPTDRNAPPLGARLWLDLKPAEINALPGPSWRKVLLRAMHRYGMIFTDTGANTYFNIETEAGSQYVTMGATDRWLQFGKTQTNAPSSDWSLFSDTYVGRMPGGRLNGIDWTKKVWSRLRVLDPCESTVRGCTG